MIVLVFLFICLLGFRKIMDLKRSDSILHNTHVSICIEISKTYIYRKRHWLHSVKFNSELCPLKLRKRYFFIAVIYKQCDKHIFRGTENTKNGRNQRKIDEHLNHTAISGHIFEVLATIGLDSKKFELHSLQSDGTLIAAMLGTRTRDTITTKNCVFYVTLSGKK